MKVDKQIKEASYNTRGSKHTSERRDYDTIFNKGFVWHPLFDTIVKDSLSKTSTLNYSNHLKSQISDNTEGNREFASNEITIDNLKKGEVVEVEFQYEDYLGDDFNCLKKAVIRLPQRPDGEQVVAVCLFNYNGTVFIKTAWLNKANDNHQKGLDTSDFDYNINQKFGYFHRGWTSRVWEIKNGSVKELKPNVAMTIEEYNRRNGR